MAHLITKEEYLNDSCGASSLPFWKTEQIKIPSGVCVVRENEYSGESCPGTDVPYFRMIHTLENVQRPGLPDGYVLTGAGAEELADHIRGCYTEEGVTAEELETYTHRPVYDPELWIAVREKETGRIVASGIGELDARIGEGILEWIQVSPRDRRKGFGRAVVCELLSRMSEKASFVTVSGRVDHPDRPMALYGSCGFAHPVIWHVVTRAAGR